MRSQPTLQMISMHSTMQILGKKSVEIAVVDKVGCVPFCHLYFLHCMQ